MKHFFCFLFLTFFVAVLHAQEIPNGGFESWSGSPEVPDSWGALNFSIPLLGNFVSATKSTDSHTGDFALALESINIPVINLAIPGAATTGTLNQFTFQSSGGFPFELRPNAIKGYYKYQPSGADTASVEALLTRWNEDLGKRDTVGYGKKIFRDAIGSYKLFSVPIVLDATATPDTARITVYSSSRSNPTAGSKLFLDDLEFFTTTAGMSETQSSSIALYPNPATQMITVKGAELTSQHTIHITNVLGQNLCNAKCLQGGQNLNIENLQKGLYFCTVTDAQGVIIKNFKFIINN
jgi:hypothetical protein